MDIIKGYVLVIVFLDIHGLETVVTPKQKAVSKGDNVTLPCQFNATAQCSWSRHGELRVIVVDGRYQYVDNHMQFHDNSAYGDCSLIIRNINETLDLGIWTCRVKLKSHTELQKTELIKAQVPMITSTTTGLTNEILEKSYTSLESSSTLSTESTSIERTTTGQSGQHDNVQVPTSDPGIQSHLLAAGIGGGFAILLCIICFLYWRLNWIEKISRISTRRSPQPTSADMNNIGLHISSVSNEGYSLINPDIFSPCTAHVQPRQAEQIVAIRNKPTFPTQKPEEILVTSSEMVDEYQYENISGQRDRIYYELQ